jgi:hypothetical protein
LTGRAVSQVIRSQQSGGARIALETLGEALEIDIGRVHVPKGQWRAPIAVAHKGLIVSYVTLWDLLAEVASTIEQHVYRQVSEKSDRATHN